MEIHGHKTSTVCCHGRWHRTLAKAQFRASQPKKGVDPPPHGALLHSLHTWGNLEQPKPSLWVGAQTGHLPLQGGIRNLPHPDPDPETHWRLAWETRCSPGENRGISLTPETKPPDSDFVSMQHSPRRAAGPQPRPTPPRGSLQHFFPGFPGSKPFSQQMSSGSLDSPHVPPLAILCHRGAPGWLRP